MYAQTDRFGHYKSPEARAEREQATMDRVEADLLSGHYFTLIANSLNSVPKGSGPVTARGWANVMEAIAKYAQQGDRFAAQAASLYGSINLYATPYEVVAQVATGLAAIARADYYDVVSATGPEASRPSAHRHPHDLRTALYMALLMVEVQAACDNTGSVPGVGWCVSRLLTRENVSPYAVYMPRVAKILAK